MDYDQFLEQVQKDLEDHFANQKEGKYSQVRIGIQEVDKLQGENPTGGFPLRTGIPRLRGV